MNCESIQELLLDGATMESLDDAHRTHVEGCAECAAFGRSLLAVDHHLDHLESVPAPEALVQRTLETVHALDEPAPGVLGTLAGRLGRGALAVVELVVMPFKAIGAMRGPKLGLVLGAPALVALFVGMSFFAVGDESIVASRGAGSIDGVAVQSPAFEPPEEARRSRYGIEGIDEDEESEDPMAALGALIGDGEGEVAGDDDDYWADRGGQGQISDLLSGLPSNDRGVVLGTDRAQGAFESTVEGRFDQANLPVGAEALNRQANVDSNQPARPPAQDVSRGEPEPDDSSGERLRELDESEIDRTVATPAERTATLIPEIPETVEATGRRVLEIDVDGRDATHGLQFQEARGLWANRYVPGDPRWRLLARELRARTQPLSGLGVTAYELAREAEPVAPRIAAPRQSALALSVQSDRAEIEGQTRVLMQVGVRAASSRGRRPTLRSVVVLDLRRPLDDAQQAQMRGLLQAISRSRTGADRIGILVAGPHGGWLVEPGPLRFGEVTVALRQAMAREGGTPTELDAALGTAIESVNGLDDADSPLGSGLVWMITPGLDGTRALEGAAHAGALAGVTTTTIGLTGADADALENVAMAGHGRRWIADEDPQELVRSEIAAVSRVVARALRLNVKLAPGVRLVDVLGSRRLDDQSAQRARASERALDRQLASRLGIRADRERDDDGISILIPAFYADDTHTILLDLVVDHAGPVADVSLRYKDLLRLDNTEANERLVLSRGNAQRGPAQRDVMRDWLAYETSASLQRAARLLSSDRGRALHELHAARQRIERVGGTLRLPRAQVQASASVCARFADALQAGADASLMADSLQYASRRLIFGDPLDGTR